MTREKRKYTRLSASTWSEISALWEIGDVTLPELAERYSISTRTLQTQFAKGKIIKGSKAAEMAAVVKKEIFDEALGNQDTLVSRAKETREAAYINATIIEGLIMAQLTLAQKDPTQAFKSSTALKACSLAASALERLHAIKLRALGLDGENALPDELPTLILRDLSSAELKDLHERNEDGEEGELAIPIVPPDSDLGLTGTEVDESDDIIIEGEEGLIEGDVVIVGSDERDEQAKPRSTLPDIHGGRLVKEALH